MKENILFATDMVVVGDTGNDGCRISLFFFISTYGV